MRSSHSIYPDNGFGDVINDQYASVNVIDRFPAAGMPPVGSPFSITVEVRTWKTGGPSLFRTPFACLDAFIAVRGLGKYGNQILGGSFVRTGIPDCRGTATITLDPSFRPGTNDNVQIELYAGGTTEWFQPKTTLEMVRQNKIAPLAVSQPMNFALSLDQGINSGVYSEKKSIDWAGDAPKMLQSATMLLAIGAGVYFLAPFVVPKAIESIKNVKESISDK